MSVNNWSACSREWTRLHVQHETRDLDISCQSCLTNTGDNWNVDMEM